MGRFRTVDATEIIQIARSWVGTPYYHHQRRKQIGVDCVNLILGIAEELGYKIPTRNYYALPNGQELIQELDSHLIKIDQSQAAIADILCFKLSFVGLPTHVGIKSDRGLIHADARTEKVVETELGYWERLTVGAWSFPPLEVE